MARESVLGMSKPQISPLRCAPVEMTKGRVVMARESVLGMSKPQISPLRCAPVEMTKGRVVKTRSSGLGMSKNVPQRLKPTVAMSFTARLKLKPCPSRIDRLHPA
jgi:hypothetical protein